MTTIEELLTTAQDLIDHIEDLQQSVNVDLRNLNEASGDIDTAIDDLSSQTHKLEMQIANIQNQPPSDPVALATTEAIDNIVTLLTQAKNYFAAGENMAAFGTLIMFDEHADDLKAAIRLCKMANRRAK